MKGAKTMEVALQRRNPQTGKVITSGEAFDPSRTLILVIDAWEYHWCSTWCGLGGGRIARRIPSGTGLEDPKNRAVFLS